MAVEAGTIYSEVRIELNKLRGDIQSMTKQFNQFAKNNQTQATTVKQSWTKGFKNIGLAGVAAFAGIGLAIKAAIKQFADFEQSMANVQSVARGTPEEFKRLEDAARKAGETTKFTASEAADAMYYLASAGMSATEVVESLDGVLQLAGATQSDLAFTSATVAAALSQFGIEASESGRIANVFTAAISNSQANMDKLANALQQAGPIAGALGISLEDVTGALQALFDAGFQGEKAGTALRNVMSALADETDPTTRKLIDFGLTFEQLNPAVNSLSEIIGHLNDASLETGQVLSAFGRRAGPQIVTLLKTGKAGLEEYTAAITDTNAAAEAYAIQMDTLEGSQKTFQSALESTGISIIKEFTPAIRGLLDILTKIVRFFGQLPTSVKIFIGILAGGIPLVYGAAIAFTTLSAAVGAALGPITLVVAGLAGLIAGITAVVNAAKQARLEDIEDRFGRLAEAIGVSDERMVDLVKTAEQLGAKGDKEVGKVITKLKEFQDETVISDEKLDSLIRTAQRLGSTDKDIDVAVRQVKNLTDNLGLSAREIETINTALYHGMYFGDAEEQVRELAKNTGLTREQILMIGMASRNVTDEYRSQLQGLLDQEMEQKRIHDGMRALAESRAQMSTDRKKADEDEKKRQEEIEKKRQEDANNELARQAEIIEKKITAEADLQEALKQTKILQDANIIDEKESIESEIKAREQYAKTLVGIGDLNKQDNATLEEQARILAELKSRVKNYKDEVVPLDGRYKDISEQTRNYEMQLLQLVGTEEEVLEAQRRIALAEADRAGGSIWHTHEQKKAINELYDALIKKSKEAAQEVPKTFQEILGTVQKFTDEAIGLFGSFTTAITELTNIQADNQVEAINRVLETEVEALNARLLAELEAAGVAEETDIERLERELQEALAKGDQESAALLQDEITRTQIKKKYADEQAEIEAEAERKIAQIQYDAALQEWEMKLALAIANAAAAIIKLYASFDPITASIMALATGAVTGVQIAAIDAAKPQPPAFKAGGMVIPYADMLIKRWPVRGYQTGGITIPSGTEGRLIKVAENGAPEMMLNAGGEGSAMMDMFAQRIARSMSTGAGGAGSRVIEIPVNIDGIELTRRVAEILNNGQVRLLK